jgi:phytanoyl-CoA hydroxylase
MIEQKYIEAYKTEGYAVVPGLFSPEETARLREHYMELRGKGTYPGDFEGVDPTAADPLKRYPRMIHMHRWDDLSMKWLLDERLRAHMNAFEGEDPYAVQTMLYFKPPGARGQALHQDQFYLRAQPGTCIAAWLALDDCDEENGCMKVVPGSHDLPILCTERADTTQSFTDVTVPLPEGMEPVSVYMKAGDVLFFNGWLIHGSFPNVSKDRFRRALIGHYITGRSEQAAEFYHPILDFKGNVMTLGVSPYGEKCGVWVEQDGKPAVELRDKQPQAAPAHE